MRKKLIILGCVLAAVVSCRKEKDDKKEENNLSQLSCIKEGVYCYSVKEGFGFVESFCRDDGGFIGLVCDPNPVITCENDTRIINLYGEQFKDASCDDVGLPIED